TLRPPPTSLLFPYTTLFRSRITAEHPLIAEGRQVVIARNREYVTGEAPLGDGDELALIPPVSGGDARTLAAIAVTAAPLSVDDRSEERRVGKEGRGAAWGAQ